MKLSQRLIAAALILLAAAGLTYLVLHGSNTSGKSSQGLPVTASIYPLGEFARAVGGGAANVQVLVPPGTEPHDFDPTPRDIADLHRSRLLIYNGGGLEPWAERLRGELESDGAVVVNASGLPAGSDPHVWLDPVRASRQVAVIRDGFIKADPGGKDRYQANAAALTSRLDALDRSYREGLANCPRRRIVTTHRAFDYLAKRYGFEAVSLTGLSPDEEPSPQRLAEIADYVRANDIKYIFVEALASPKLADTIARETGAQTLEFNPIEGMSAPGATGQDYFTLQAANLANIRVALDCR
jgi:zinc transport system substrate-binding protein